MRIAVVFDSPYSGWTPERHLRQMEGEVSGKVQVEEPDVEYQLGHALIDNGHEVLLIGIHDDLREIMDQCTAWKPDLVMNCAESFGDARHDYVYPALLEANGIRYTGTPPLGLLVPGGLSLR